MSDNESYRLGQIKGWIAVILAALAMFIGGVRVVERNTGAIRSLTTAVERLEELNQDAIRVASDHGERLSVVESKIAEHERRLDRLEAR